MSAGGADTSSQPLPAATGGNNAPSTQPEGALATFGHNLISGQGQPTQQNQLMAMMAKNQMQQADPSSPQYQQMQQIYNQNVNPDNGGYLGTAMRVLSNQGQNPMEQIVGALGKVGYGLYLNNKLNQAMANSNGNMQNWGNNFASNASNALSSNIGQKF